MRHQLTSGVSQTCISPFDYFVDKIYVGCNQIIIAFYNRDMQHPSRSRASKQRSAADTERGKCEHMLEGTRSTLPPQVEMGGLRIPRDSATAASH